MTHQEAIAEIVFALAVAAQQPGAVIETAVTEEDGVLVRLRDGSLWRLRVERVD